MPGDGPVDIVHIGRPISNTEIYILDNNRQVVDVGMRGEIYSVVPGWRVDI